MQNMFKPKINKEYDVIKNKQPFKVKYGDSNHFKVINSKQTTDPLKEFMNKKFYKYINH